MGEWVQGHQHSSEVSAGPEVNHGDLPQWNRKTLGRIYDAEQRCGRADPIRLCVHGRSRQLLYDCNRNTRGERWVAAL